jgi:hypothetical protein
MHGRTSHCVYNINYHIVFCPKFRHKIIKGLVEDVVKQLIQEICNTYGYTLIPICTYSRQQGICRLPESQEKLFLGQWIMEQGLLYRYCRKRQRRCHP